MQTINSTVHSTTSIFLLIAILTVFTGGGFVNTAYAAALLNKSDTMSSLTVGAASNHTIVFRTPTGVDATGETITITFPSGFDMNGIDFADIDLAHSAGGQTSCTGVSFANDETLAAAAAASEWGAVVAGQVLTLTPETSGPAIATNACVQIEIGTNADSGDTQILNPGTDGSYSIEIGGVFGDFGNILVPILTDDQVSVSAVVAESLTFTISDTTIGFGTLTSGAARYATGNTNGDTNPVDAHTLVVGTNAANGYTMTVAGNTLTFGSETIDAIGDANTASNPGSEQFGLRMIASGGDGTVSAPYAAAGFAYDTAAFPDEVASAPNATADTTYSAQYIANIASNTAAGNYTATLTYVATANF